MPVYHVDRKVKETGEEFGDISHIVYVNGKCQDNSPLGKLMQDFHCINPDNMHYEVLKKRVRYFKKEKEGVDSMCQMLDEMRTEAEKRGENKFSNLIKALIADSRQDLIGLVASDAKKREEYYCHYHLE